MRGAGILGLPIASGSGDPRSTKTDSRTYALETQEDTDAYYSAWAATRDEELTRHGYRAPQCRAEALAQFVSADAPILDLGCGTGLSGAALSTAGFTDVSGTDINADRWRSEPRSTSRRGSRT